MTFLLGEAAEQSLPSGTLTSLPFALPFFAKASSIHKWFFTIPESVSPQKYLPTFHHGKTLSG